MVGVVVVTRQKQYGVAFPHHNGRKQIWLAVRGGLRQKLFGVRNHAEKQTTAGKLFCFFWKHIKKLTWVSTK